MQDTQLWPHVYDRVDFWLVYCVVFNDGPKLWGEGPQESTGVLLLHLVSFSYQGPIQDSAKHQIYKVK